ncbi:MAG: pbuE 1 [Firmicutes bacterium]|nr:pbuE 1 [Bacillota bacterium]
MLKQPLWTKKFVLISISNFFQFMTFYALISTLPAFVLNSLGDSQQAAGMAVSAFMISALLIRPLAGQWVDKLERKKLLLLSLGFFFLVSFGYLGATTISIILVIRFLQGIAFGIANTVTATLAAEFIPEERKGEGIGYFATCMSLAVALGPFLGLTIIAHYSFDVLFIIIVGLSFLALVAAALIKIPEVRIHDAVNHKTSWSLKQYFEPSAVPGGIASLCILFSFSGIATFVSLYAADLGMSEYARYFFILYAVMVVLARPVAGRMLDKFGPDIVVYPAIILFTVALVILSRLMSPSSFLVVGGLIGVGFGSLFSSFQTIAVSSAPSNRKGLATSTFLLLTDLGMGLGPFILGFIVAWTNYSSMYMVTASVVGLAALAYYALGRVACLKGA